MIDVLMKIGNKDGAFTFGVSTAAYQTLQRRIEIFWITQNRLWNAPAVQYTGEGPDLIDLDGYVLPAAGPGLRQIELLRQLAKLPRLQAEPEPLLLVTGYGEVLGEWVILGVEESQSSIGQLGAPMEQGFSLRLQRYVRDTA